MPTKRNCAHCWAATPVNDNKVFCMFPSCPLNKPGHPLRRIGCKADRKRKRRFLPRPAACAGEAGRS